MWQIIYTIPIRIDGVCPDGIPIYGFGVMLFLAFILCTWLASRRAAKLGIAKERIQDLAIWLFVGGILLFSGSLYVLSTTGIRWLGAITPIGGVGFLVGWILLVWAVWR